MKFNEKELSGAIAKELAGEGSEKESILIRNWLADDTQNAKVFASIRDEWFKDQPEFQSEKVYKRLKNRIRLDSENNKAKMKLVKNNDSRSYLMKIAAILVVIVGIGYFIAYENSAQLATPEIEVVQIEKSNPKGQKSTIFLSDGTKIILNSGSKISYIKGFTQGKREVHLTGEAYFEVAKDKSRPFTVISNDIATTALGTAFNISAYPSNDEITISLTEGKVKIEDQKSAIDNHILQPGQQLIYNKPERVSLLEEFDVEKVTSWKDGIILFSHADQQSIFNTLEYWYGVDFIVNLDIPENWNISARFDNESLENVLTSLSYSKGFAFEINRQKVFINSKEKNE